ncbi:DUF6470 family protein [Alkaliphilus serpentinus]|uniref:Uncharacterized protein n=1 Tax=Alkaliphilus serpentinus TaxID=1482731 RepID=A0A833HLV4_9FIRM|nr:DUF6470 family protein [Alkaliphilus serpentinus]KAB3526644.1 hypothetical protein F8153_13665 [Alkaliphilus serpentinus]
MQIRIQSQSALIGINSNFGEFSIQQNQWPMKLSTKDSKLHIQSEEAVLLIDQSRCFAEAGLKSTMEMSRELANKGRVAALQATARIAGEGKEMADIHNGMAIARQAKARYAAKEKSFNFDMIPKSRPEIEVIQGEVSGYVERGYIDLNMGKITPDIKYYRGDINIYLKQKNYLKIDFVGENVNVLGG